MLLAEVGQHAVSGMVKVAAGRIGLVSFPDPHTQQRMDYITATSYIHIRLGTRLGLHASLPVLLVEMKQDAGSGVKDSIIFSGN